MSLVSAKSVIKVETMLLYHEAKCNNAASIAEEAKKEKQSRALVRNVHSEKVLWQQ